MGARVSRAANIFSVAMMAMITPAPAAARYISKKPFLSVLT